MCKSKTDYSYSLLGVGGKESDRFHLVRLPSLIFFFISFFIPDMSWSSNPGRTSVAAVSSQQDFASHQRSKNKNANRYQIFHDRSSLGYAIVAYRYRHQASKTCTRIPLNNQYCRQMLIFTNHHWKERMASEWLSIAVTKPNQPGDVFLPSRCDV